VCDKGKEGRTLTRDSNSEFTCASLKTSNIPFAWFLVLGCNRQAQTIIYLSLLLLSSDSSIDFSLIFLVFGSGRREQEIQVTFIGFQEMKELTG